MRNKTPEQLIWASKLYPKLVMTDRMLAYLRHHYSQVKSWKQMMLDLEVYLTKHPEKTPKDFKRFVLNCGKRHADDVLKGLRKPDGTVNLKAFANRSPERPSREESFTADVAADRSRELRRKLSTLERGTPEYDRTLAEIRSSESTQPVLSFADIMNRIAEAGRS